MLRAFLPASLHQDVTVPRKDRDLIKVVRPGRVSILGVYRGVVLFNPGSKTVCILGGDDLGKQDEGD